MNKIRLLLPLLLCRALLRAVILGGKYLDVVKMRDAMAMSK